jgi:hypothetical protein
MIRTTIMLPKEMKRRAVAHARQLSISSADFVRQAVAEKLPSQGHGTDRLKRRRRPGCGTGYATLSKTLFIN